MAVYFATLRACGQRSSSLRATSSGTTLRELYLLPAKLYHQIAPLLAAVFLAGLWALRRDIRLMLVIVILCFVGPALLLAVSLYESIFGVRMLSWATPPAAALMGVGVASVPRLAAPLCLVFAGAVAWLICPALDQQYTRLDKEPWRELVKIVEALQPGAIVVAATAEEAMIISYYRERHVRPVGKFRFLAEGRAECVSGHKACSAGATDGRTCGGAPEDQSHRVIVIGHATFSRGFAPSTARARTNDSILACGSPPSIFATRA
jgi:hypothetical protein